MNWDKFREKYLGKEKPLTSFDNFIDLLLDSKTEFFEEPERFITQPERWIDLYFWENGFFKIFNDSLAWEKATQKQELKNVLSWYDENFSKAPYLAKNFFSYVSYQSLKIITDHIKKENLFFLDFNVQNQLGKKIYTDNYAYFARASDFSLKKYLIKDKLNKKNINEINDADITCDLIKELQEKFLLKIKQQIKNNKLDLNFDYKILCSQWVLNIFKLHFEYKSEKNNCPNSFWTRYDNGTLEHEKKALTSLYQFLFDDLKIIVNVKKDRKLKKLYLVKEIINYLKIKKINCFGTYYEIWKLFVDDLYKKKSQKQILFNLLKSYYRIYYKDYRVPKWEFINCSFFKTNSLFLESDFLFEHDAFKNIDMIFVPFENNKNVAFTFGIFTKNIKYWNFKALNQKNNIYSLFTFEKSVFFKTNDQKLKHLFAFKQK